MRALRKYVIQLKYKTKDVLHMPFPDMSVEALKKYQGLNPKPSDFDKNC